MPKPADYPRIPGQHDARPMSREQDKVITSALSEKSIGSRSVQSSCSERAKEYVQDVVGRVFDTLYNERV